MPPDLHVAVSTILRMAHRLYSSGAIGPHPRMEWPLFMAGVETRSTIEAEWVLDKLVSRPIRPALEKVLKLQEQHGPRINVSCIREVFCPDEVSLY